MAGHVYNCAEKQYDSCVVGKRSDVWFIVSVPEIMNFSNIDQAEITSAFKKQVDALVKCQDENGLWHTDLDNLDSYCEVSASAGFVYEILLGICMGILGQEYMDCALKGAQAVIEKVAEDGTVTEVSTGTGIPTTSEMYCYMDKSKIMSWCQGLTIMMLMELDMLKNK